MASSSEGSSPELSRESNRQVNPPGTATFGMALFLVALGMLFLSSMVGYTIIRITSATREVAPPLGEMHTPLGLWLSTLLILASSLTIHMAITAARQGKQALLRQMLVATNILGWLFVAVQVPSLMQLLATHHEVMESETRLYGLVLFFIGVHGLHVLGGLIPLAIVTRHAFQGRYDHEHYDGVFHMGMYWHFLDIVWLVMFTTFLVLG